MGDEYPEASVLGVDLFVYFLLLTSYDFQTAQKWRSLFLMKLKGIGLTLKVPQFNPNGCHRTSNLWSMTFTVLGCTEKSDSISFMLGKCLPPSGIQASCYRKPISMLLQFLHYPKFLCFCMSKPEYFLSAHSLPSLPLSDVLYSRAKPTSTSGRRSDSLTLLF